MRENYINQVELLLDVLPVVMKDRRLALEGGTAINFFLRKFYQKTKIQSLIPHSPVLL